MSARAWLIGFLSCVIAAGLVSAALALPAGTEDDSSGVVSATVHWDGARAESAVSGARLSITRGGAVAFDEAIPAVLCNGCRLATVPAGEPPHGDVAVHDLDGDGEPEVLVEGFSGGADNPHARIGIFDYRPATGGYGELDGSYPEDALQFRDLDRDGNPEIETRDARFTGLFGPARFTWRPPVVQRYVHRDGVGILVDVTRRFPAVIRADARATQGQLNDFAHQVEDLGDIVRPVLAAHVADEYLLGRGAVAIRQLDALIASGAVGSPKVAAAYRARLLKLLRRFGYR